ncbi:hypothetical protein Tco_0301131 [Tanacetum coccineum]
MSIYSSMFNSRILLRTFTLQCFVADLENDHLSSNAMVYGNQIRELYHSLPYLMIEFVIDDTDWSVHILLMFIINGECKVKRVLSHPAKAEVRGGTSWILLQHNGVYYRDTKSGVLSYSWLGKIDKRCGDDVMYKLNKQGCLEFDLKRAKSVLLFEEDPALVDLDGVVKLTSPAVPELFVCLLFDRSQ